jgi:hypothetical protein
MWTALVTAEPLPQPEIHRVDPGSGSTLRGGRRRGGGRHCAGLSVMRSARDIHSCVGAERAASHSPGGVV